MFEEEKDKRNRQYITRYRKGKRLPPFPSVLQHRKGDDVACFQPRNHGKKEYLEPLG
jgi:hypothetical protein